MSDCLLSERQRELLRSILPELKNNTIPKEWFVMVDRGEITGIKGFWHIQHVWDAVWKGKIELADFAAFERCGLLERIAENNYLVIERAIIDTVEGNLTETSTVADCSLTPRQKNLLRSIVPGLKDRTVDAEWYFQIGDLGINGIIGLPREIWDKVWKDEDVKGADFRAFERCGFFEKNEENHYFLFPQAIIDAVESNFSERQDTYTVGSPGQIVVKPVFGPPLSKTRPWSQVFVLMPFEKNLRPIFEDHIKKVSRGLGLTCKRADDFFSTEAIIRDVWSAIYYCEICIVDCTKQNPNVFYELGVAHTLGKHCILIAQSEKDFPFDLKHLRHIVYEYTPSGMEVFEEKLEKTLQNELNERSSQIRVNNEDREIRPGDVLEAFKKIPDLADDEEAIKQNLHSALKELQERGVMYVSQLNDLVTNETILSTLRSIYIEMLKRELPHVLDPVAVAVYGSIFFVHGLSDKNIRFVKQDIKTTDEYRKKNPGTFIG